MGDMEEATVMEAWQGDWWISSGRTTVNQTWNGTTPCSRSSRLHGSSSISVTASVRNSASITMI